MVRIRAVWISFALLGLGVLAQQINPRFEVASVKPQPERFEIDARAGGDVTTDDVRLMVRSLLEERFGLVTHTDSREMRHFRLLLARPTELAA